MQFAVLCCKDSLRAAAKLSGQEDGDDFGPEPGRYFACLVRGAGVHREWHTILVRLQWSEQLHGFRRLRLVDYAIPD